MRSWVLASSHLRTRKDSPLPPKSSAPSSEQSAARKAVHACCDLTNLRSTSGASEPRRLLKALNTEMSSSLAILSLSPTHSAFSIWDSLSHSSPGSAAMSAWAKCICPKISAKENSRVIFIAHSRASPRRRWRPCRLAVALTAVQNLQRRRRKTPKDGEKRIANRLDQSALFSLWCGIAVLTGWGSSAG